MFTVREPEGVETPVIVEIPHASVAVPPTVLARMISPARALAHDADLYVDDLYAGAPALGATLLVAGYSRYVVDLNRGENDYDSDAVRTRGRRPEATPRGVIWRVTTEGYPILAEPLETDEFARRIDSYYRPYHQALADLIRAKKERFGHAVILAAHSMPSVARKGHPDLGNRADVVPGTNGRTTAAAELIARVEEAARTSGFSLRHDDPYRGGYTTRHYGQPERRVHVLQVEIARRLYMDEGSLRKRDSFPKLKAWCEGLVSALGSPLAGGRAK